MRIKTERKPTLGIIGKIKVGELSEKGYPISLDYFKATSDHQRYVDIFNQLYPKMNQLPICFSCNEDSFNISHVYEIRNNQGKLYSYGDGETFFVSMRKEFKIVTLATINEKYGGVEAFMNKTQEHLTNDRFQPKWNEVLTLRFIIAKVPILGVWELRTMAAKSSINQILDSYDMIKKINGESVAQVPFFLSVKKVKSSRVLDQSRVYPVISLDPLLPELAQQNIFDAQLLEEAKPKLLIEDKKR